MDKGKYPHSFEQLKRDFEIAYLANDDYTDLLYALAKAIVSSCANKCMQVDSVHQADYGDGFYPLIASQTISFIVCTGKIEISFSVKKDAPPQNEISFIIKQEPLQPIKRGCSSSCF